MTDEKQVSSEEELEKEVTSEEETKKGEEETEKKSEEESEEKSEEETKETEEESTPTVPLSDFTRTKDVLFRVAEKVLGDDKLLATLAEEDPKLLTRLKGEFPKKFKDVVVPAKEITDEDIDARVERIVAERMKSSGKDEKLQEFRRRINLTEIEFEDIKDEIDAKAERLMDTEVAGNFSDALMQAYRLLDPVKAKRLIQKEVVEEQAEREKSSKAGTAQSQGKKSEFSKTVLQNYKELGFKSPQEMLKYSTDDINISDAIK